MRRKCPRRFKHVVRQGKHEGHEVIDPITRNLTFLYESGNFAKINTKINNMIKKYSLDGSFTYEITGRSGEKYRFNHKGIESYPESTFFPFDGNIIFIFVKDIDSDKPILIDIDNRSDWSVRFKDLNSYEFIKKNNPTHILFMRNVIRGEEFSIITDILNGGEFDLGIYNYRHY